MATDTALTPGQLAFRARLESWRAIPPGEQLARLGANAGAGDAPGFDPGRNRSIKLLVLGCDYRGDFATECGCTSTRVCLAGKGRPVPGTSLTDVTDRDCRECVGG